MIFGKGYKQKGTNMDYNVYFEIGGKKLCQKVTADSKPQAIQKVRDDIIFHKVVPYKEPEQKPDYKLPFDNPLEKFNELFGGILKPKH